MLQLLIVIRLASFRWPKISFWSVYKYFNTLTFYCYKCFQFCLFRYFVFTTEVFLLIGVVVFLLLLLLILFDWLLLVFSLSVSSVSLPCWCCHTRVSLSFFCFCFVFCCLIDPGCLSHCCCHPGVSRTTDQPLPNANPLLRVYASAHTNHTIPLVWYHTNHTNHTIGMIPTIAPTYQTTIVWKEAKIKQKQLQTINTNKAQVPTYQPTPSRQRLIAQSESFW